MEIVMKYRWLQTSYKEKKIVTTEAEGTSYPDEGQENQAVNLYPDFQYQVFEGFGGSMTEASAFTWHTMSVKSKKELLEAYFGENGLGYNQVRMSLDSCDACLNNYSAMDDEQDREMKSFSLARDERYILPFWEAAREVSGSLLRLC
jgi:O-Glycosyl hydrolase